ncbi:MAG TPA: proprotein convertase P-domain-containing protein [Solirubrobacteraceae bacterium]|nr:proprotein convertase P-domain-containing protein [Solirubrobacteraceae bacterium]
MAGMRQVVAIAAVVAMAVSAETAGAGERLDRKAAAQIAKLQQFKQSLSRTERKLDSRLAVELSGRALAPTGVEVARGTTDVDVRATAVTDDLLDRLKRAGAVVDYASRRIDSVRASLPLSALERVAGWTDVERVDAAVGSLTAEAVSEGDRAHAADVARETHRVTGVGVKLCALSDGVNSLAASQAADELPAVDVLPGQAGAGNEGTAMLEILHDLAPRAELGFATATTSDASFADNIRALRSVARCDVIVDDILYFNEHPFQDGPIARAVNEVIADGALYFSSAGNEGNTIDGTSGNYEGDFADSGLQAGKFAGAAHDFDPGAGVQIFNPISPASSDDVPVTLFWADRLGGAASDYDLYLFDGNSNVVAFSQDVQDGDDDPYELLFTPLFGGNTLRLAVVRYRGESRYFQLSALRGRFRTSADGLVARATPGVTRGHSAALHAFSTAAAPAFEPYPFDLEPGDPKNPIGPFPESFTRQQEPERFTSDGPRRVFFHADGTPITPGNFSSTGGAVRPKPDLTAADGVTTSLAAFRPFFGTSAAAPHAAAIAGLVLSGNPGGDTAMVREAFDATALDLVEPGFDSRTGSGLIRADRVLEYTGATPQPLVRALEPTVVAAGGDGDAYLEPGESGTLTLPVKNEGDGMAGGVSVTVSAPDPQVSVTPRARSYGDLPAGETRTRDFSVALDEDYPLGKRFALNVRVTFAGVLSPTTRVLQVGTGQAAAAPTLFSFAGPPIAIPDNSAAGATVSIPVTGIGYAHALSFSVDGTTCSAASGATTVGIDHTFMSDLTGTLTAPDGRTATLFNRRGGSGNNLCKVVFDDAAARPFASVVVADNPFTGTWRPEMPLNAFLDAPVTGTWTFKVADAAPRDTGSIRGVTLSVTGFIE